MSLVNIAAERLLIGSLLVDPSAVPRVIRRVQPDDLTGPNALILASIAKLSAENTRIDLVSVTEDLRRLGHAQTVRQGAYLHDLMESVPVAAMVDSYVEPILAMRRRRLVQEIGARLGQLAESDTADHELAVIETIGQLDQLVGSLQIEQAPSMTAEDLVALPQPEPDWIFPGVLEREDRLLITANEGGGKSVLVRQLAVCAAAGVHPFTGERVRPRRVLMVDCENSMRRTQRHMMRLMSHATKIGRPTEGRLRFEIRPSGLDLTSSKDSAWLLERVTTNQPELLTIGPLYRLYQGDPNDERTARQVSIALDNARLRTGAALITETHAGHGQQHSKERDLRPKGSSLWRAWPEMVRALRPVVAGDPSLVDLEMVGRGDREERTGWPDCLRYGGQDEWPWVGCPSEMKAATRRPKDFYSEVAAS